MSALLAGLLMLATPLSAEWCRTEAATDGQLEWCDETYPATMRALAEEFEASDALNDLPYCDDAGDVALCDDYDPNTEDEEVTP